MIRHSGAGRASGAGGAGRASGAGGAGWASGAGAGWASGAGGAGWASDAGGADGAGQLALGAADLADHRAHARLPRTLVGVGVGVGHPARVELRVQVPAEPALEAL